MDKPPIKARVITCSDSAVRGERADTSGPAVRELLERHGFEAVVYGHDSEPNYLTFNAFAYWLGVLHQRFSPSFLRPTLFAFGRRRTV